MMPAEYEFMYELMDNITQLARDEARLSGRNTREILENMRREGIFECSDTRFAELVQMSLES